MIPVVSELGRTVGIMSACDAMAIPRASYYRQYREPKAMKESRSNRSHRRLSDVERQQVLDVCHDTAYIDKAPYEIYATLLDKGSYLCSVSTMYRLLRSENEVRERRNQRTHPSYRKPELLATRPNTVWSWDITKLLGPVKWSYFYLYVILDIFSRYVVGWMIAGRESADLAGFLIEETCLKQGVDFNQLTIHSDRGPAMKAKTMAQLLANLGITKSFSRPHVSNDNPFSESHFKTLKYRPTFPKRFGSLEDAKSFCQEFFTWYNQDHRHTGIALLPPEVVHYGLASDMITRRNQVLLEAYRRNPERFVNKIPTAPQLPEAVWINPPENPDGQQGNLP